jgi:hypothetical protein
MTRQQQKKEILRENWQRDLMSQLKISGKTAFISVNHSSNNNKYKLNRHNPAAYWGWIQ